MFAPAPMVQCWKVDSQRQRDRRLQSKNLASSILPVPRLCGKQQALAWPAHVEHSFGACTVARLEDNHMDSMTLNGLKDF